MGKVDDVTAETDFQHSRTGDIDVYQRACIETTYTVDHFLQDSETWEKYHYYLVKETADSDWRICDQGPNV